MAIAKAKIADQQGQEEEDAMLEEEETIEQQSEA